MCRCRRAASLTTCLISLGLVAATLLLSAGVCVAQGGEPSLRSCRRADLPGMWEMVSQQVPEEGDRDDPALSKHQLFLFHADGSFSQVVSEEPLTETEKAVVASYESPATYTMDADGTLRLQHPAREAQLVACTYFEDDQQIHPGARRDDILLTYWTTEGQLQIQQVLRRLE